MYLQLTTTNLPGLGTFGDRSYAPPPPTVNYIKEEHTDNDKESVDTEEK